MVVLSKLIENFIIWLAVLSFCDFFKVKMLIYARWTQEAAPTPD
jgi:hypothetical protein